MVESKQESVAYAQTGMLVLRNEPIQKVLLLACQLNWASVTLEQETFMCTVILSTTDIFTCMYCYALLYFVISHRLLHSFQLHICVTSERIWCNSVVRRGSEGTHEWTMPSSCLLPRSTSTSSLFQANFVHTSAARSWMVSTSSPFW